MADLGFDFTDDTCDKDNQLEEEELVEDKPETQVVLYHSDKDANSLIEAIATELPAKDDLEDELLADENVTPIERVYGYKEDDALINRLLLAKELPNALGEISITKAIKDIIPVMLKLACDSDDTVRETFAGELDQTLLYFYKNSPETFCFQDSETSFATMLIRLLLDRSSGVASLGQQATVTIVTELTQLSKNNPLYSKLIHREIFQGVIEGLLLIIDGKQKSPRAQDEDQDVNRRLSVDTCNLNRRRSSTTPGFETSLNVHHAPPSDDELEQGELSLAKMACISLISSIVGSFDVDECIKLCLPIIERFSSDGSFYVRKEAAAAIGSLSSMVDSTIATERLLPLFYKFSEDQTWNVRRSCVMTLPSLCNKLPEPTKEEIVVTSIETFRNDVSRNVRNALADIVGELVAAFLPPDWETTQHPGKLPEPLLDYFLSLGTQSLKVDIDRAFICAYNFPAVVLTAGVDYWDSHLRETYLRLSKDYQIKVRCTFAHSLHAIARIIGPERTERDLVQIFALYLMDMDDVKQGVLEHLSDFLHTLASSSRNEYIPILAEVWDGVASNWHLRNILAEQLAKIALLFDASRVVEHILPLVVRACEDQYATVRESGVRIFPVILDIVKKSVEEDGETLSQAEGYGEDAADNKKNYALALFSHVMERLDEFARSDNYRGRLLFAQICKALIDTGVDTSDFASFFLPRLAPLAYDPVVNVRIAASRTIGAIYKNESFRKEVSEIAAPSRTVEPSGEPGHALDQMTYRFALDKDNDVRSFVMPYVDQATLEKQREKEMSTAIQMAEESIEARAAERDTEDYQMDSQEEYDDEEDEDEDEDESMEEGQDEDVT